MTRPLLLVVTPTGQWPAHWALAPFDVTVVEAASNLAPDLDCLVVVPDARETSDAQETLLGLTQGQHTLAVVLGVPTVLSGLESMLARHRVDGLLDLRWPDVVAVAAVHTALRHVQLGRQAAGLQRAVIAHTQQEAALQRELAIHDGLTHLFNGRHFFEVMRKTHGRTRRRLRGYGLLYMDLDNLKALNQAYGHEGGSRAIVEFARMLQSCMRPTDMAVRMGGDEFVAFLADCDLPRAHEFANRFCQMLREHTFDVSPGLPLTLTASVGVAVFPEHGRDHVEVLKHADEALLQAKACGKNQASLYDPNLAARTVQDSEP